MHRLREKVGLIIRIIINAYKLRSCWSLQTKSNLLSLKLAKISVLKWIRVLSLCDRGLSVSKILLQITEWNKLLPKSKQECVKKFLRLTVNCVATTFYNPWTANKRELKENNLFNRTFNVSLDGNIAFWQIFKQHCC